MLGHLSFLNVLFYWYHATEHDKLDHSEQLIIINTSLCHERQGNNYHLCVYMLLCMCLHAWVQCVHAYKIIRACVLRVDGVY